jgi:hypothetical protein
MREIRDDGDRAWEAVAVPAIVAHMRTGAVLGFRPADEPDAAPIEAPITFNSLAAAELAISSMSQFELKRRLNWARTEAGVA